MRYLILALAAVMGIITAVASAIKGFLEENGLGIVLFIVLNLLLAFAYVMSAVALTSNGAPLTTHAHALYALSTIEIYAIIQWNWAAAHKAIYWKASSIKKEIQREKEVKALAKIKPAGALSIPEVTSGQVTIVTRYEETPSSQSRPT